LQPGKSIEKSTRAKVLKGARNLHLWMGAFFAPAIIFFAFSGTLQTFDLHEVKRGEATQPPAWIMQIAQLHKKQNLNTRRPAPPPANPGEANSRAPEANRPPPKPPSRATWTFKVFIAVMSVGLILSTLLGLYLTIQYARDKRVMWALVVAGTLLPLAMVLLM